MQITPLVNSNLNCIDYAIPMTEQQKQNKKLKPSKIDSLMSGVYLYLWLFVGLGIGLAALVFLSVIFIPPIVDYFSPNRDFDNPYAISDKFGEILIFSLALVGASATLTIALWRGRQLDAQIRKAQELIQETQKQTALTQTQIKEAQRQSDLTQQQIKGVQEQSALVQSQVTEAQRQAELTQRQIEETRLQNAVELATERENAARCISGLRILESMYGSLSDTDKESIHSVALYVLSLPREGGARVSRSARQRALDILVSTRFLSQQNLQRSLRDGDRGLEMPVRDSMVEKDLSRLTFTRRSARGILTERESLDLSNFSFRGCNFFAANLTGVNFSNADLTGARMYGANLTRANLRNIRGVFDIGLSLTYYYGEAEAMPELLGSFTVMSWDEWKDSLAYNGTVPIEVIQETYGVRDIEPDEWSYLVNLAEDNAPYPPGVVGDDEGEEGEGE